MASVFAGKYYSQLRWAGEGDSLVRVVDDTPRFPALLSDARVRTIHAATLGRLRASQGVGLGFTTEIFISDSRAGSAVNKLVEELELDPSGPLFMYAHFNEPHAPYDGKSEDEFERYVREIGIVDRQIGRLRRYLDKRNLAKRTVLIISADHGEAFGEHGTKFHAKTAYEELLRVPLIVHVPGMRARRIDEPVTLMDVGPTVLDLFGQPTPGGFMAASLLPLVAGKDVELTRPIAADTARHHRVLYFGDGKKVILNRNLRTIEVYDLNADPGELENLSEKGDPAIQAAIETTKLFFDVHHRRTPNDG
jgi:arylsulfatase A-like enzyme